MKTKSHIKTTVVMLAAILMMAACDKTPKGDNATITDKKEVSEATGQTFAVDTSSSTVKFTGNGVGKNHPGRFSLQSGNVAVSNNQVTGGEFVINIKSIKLDQEGAMIKNKLRPHLLSGDFLDAEKFGTAKFVITQVTPYEANEKDSSIVDGANFNVSGNLTIKEDTKNITFPARIDLDGNTLKAKADFDIDRTQWKINYGNDKTLGDKFISETVNMELDLRAEKQ